MGVYFGSMNLGIIYFVYLVNWIFKHCTFLKLWTKFIVSYLLKLIRIVLKIELRESL